MQYRRSDVRSSGTEIADNWFSADQYRQAVKEQSTALAEWWNTLEDPQLPALIDQALQDNLDLQQAQSRVRQARLERTVSRASLFPSLDADGSARKSYIRDSGGSGSEADAFSAGFDASWEIDLFGGVRRSIEATQADYEAAVEALRDTRISLIAEVALNYVQVRTYQERLRVARANAASQEQTLELLTALSQAGRGDELAIAQARYNLESSRAGIPDLQTGLQESMNSLAILTESLPEPLQRQLAEQASIPTASVELARRCARRPASPQTGYTTGGTGTGSTDRPCRRSGSRPLSEVEFNGFHRPGSHFRRQTDQLSHPSLVNRSQCELADLSCRSVAQPGADSG